MKTTKWLNLLFVMMFALVGGVLTSCSDDDDPGIEDPAYLIGTWQGVSVSGSVWEDGNKWNIQDFPMEDTPEHLRIIFKDDKTWVEQTWSGTTWVSDLNGTWELVGNELKRIEAMEGPMEETEVIHTLTSNRLVIRGTYNGENEGFDMLMEWKRVTE